MVTDPDETMAKMKKKLAVARKHRDCMPPDNCIVGKPDECPHQLATARTIDQKTGAPVATEKRRALACPECGDALDTLESTVGRGVTEQGIWVSETGEMKTEVEFIDNDGADSETIGAICASCSWAIERPDWFEYLKDYEANELKRIREELEKIKRGEA